MQVAITLVGYAALFGTLDTLVQATVFDEREQPPGTAQPGDAYLVAADAGLLGHDVEDLRWAWTLKSF